MPHPAHSPIPIGEGVDEFELIVENRALYQRMKSGFLVLMGKLHIPISRNADIKPKTSPLERGWT